MFEIMSNEEKIDGVLAYVLPESQIEYLLSQLKKDRTKITTDDLSKIYIDLKHTFHVLMCKLGQMKTYEHIVDLYKDYLAGIGLKNTVMKLLVRCLNGYNSVQQISKIFKMIKRHNKLYQILDVKDQVTASGKLKNVTEDPLNPQVKKKKEKVEEMEAKVAYFCMHACRVYTLIQTFNNERLHIVSQPKPSKQ